MKTITIEEFIKTGRGGKERANFIKEMEEADISIYSHMIIACDTFNFEDFSVLVKHSENLAEKCKKYDNEKEMLKLIDIIKLPKMQANAEKSITV